MAIAYVQEAHAASEGSNTLTISKPTGTVDGHVMVALIYARDLDGRPAISAPAGWTEIATNQVHSYILDGCYYKVASSEGASYNFTKDGTTNNATMAGFIMSFSGCDIDDPVDVFSNTDYIVSDKTLRAASVTTTVANAMLVFLGQMHKTSFNPSATPPDGFTEAVDYSHPDSAAYGVYGAYGAQAAAGASGDKDATMTAKSTQKHAFLVALAPASGISIPLLNHLLLGD